MEKKYKIKWYEEIYYWLWRRYDFIRCIPQELKWKYQRMNRGFADCDVWSLHSYLSEWLPLALRQLKSNSSGCPQDTYDGKRKNNECWKWKVILEKMVIGFESDNKIMNYDYVVWTKDNKVKKIDKKKFKVLEKQMKDGLNLFVKYYQNLWD